jgi:hypothetical protein
MKHIVVIVAFALALLLILSTSKSKSKVKVYGSMSCPWTVKQLNNLPGRYEFFDCSKYKCPDFVKAYPTCEKDGQIYEGYQEKI